MSRVEQDGSAALVAAQDANWAGYIRTFGRAPHVEIHEDESFLWFITGIPDGSFNAVHRTTLTAASADRAIARALAHFRARGVPQGWLCGPLSQPADLAHRLAAHGLTRAARIPTMAVDLGALAAPPDLPDLEIRRVTTEADLERWIDTEIVGFESEGEFAAGLVRLRRGIGPGDDALRRYLGLIDGRPGATATLWIDAGVAGVYDVSTIPAYRRRGIGAAMTRAALAEARDLGYAHGVLHSSPMGFNVYRQLGFREVAWYNAYGRP